MFLGLLNFFYLFFIFILKGVELAFQRIPGVISTAVGYTDGHTENPTYHQVCSGKTGHAEGNSIFKRR